MAAGLIPWLFSDRCGLQWSTVWGFVLAGSVLIVAAAAMLPHAFARFALEGSGTPALSHRPRGWSSAASIAMSAIPFMFAVLSIILGQALPLSNWTLVAYSVIGAIVMSAFVMLNEEPTLAGRYGAEYETYRRNVPGWLTHLTRWRG